MAWVASIGWIPFAVAVARPPTVAELTFFGAGMVTSGAWPANAILVVAVALAIVLSAFLLAAAGNAVLLASLDRRSASADEAARLFVVAIAAALPATIAALLVAIGLVSVAPSEFNAPEATPGPVVRTIGRLVPQLAILGVSVAIGATHAAVAGRLALRDGTARGPGVGPTVDALRAVGAAGLIHAVVSLVARAGYLLLLGLLLGILWAPIGARLAGGGEIGAVVGLLLVGFVAIWLCGVLAGGALHAWSAATWSRLLAAGPRQVPSSGTESAWKP